MIAAALLVVASLFLPQRPIPTDSALDAQTREVGSKLRCPICQGMSIAASPSAQEMRDVIRDQLEAGRTPEQVEAYFVSKYGEWVLLEPEAKGFNLAVYILPVAMLLGGIALIAFLARKWSRAEPTPVSEEDLEPELQ